MNARTPFFVVAAVALAAALGSPALAAAEPTAATLVAQTRAALGGAALDRKRVVHVEATVTAAGLPGTGSQWLELGGNRFSESSITGPIVSADGYDGTNVWNADGSGLVWNDGGDAGRAQEIDSTYASDDTAFASDNGGATIVAGGPVTDKGVTYDSLAITPPGSAIPFTLWLDRATHLPARMVLVIGPISGSTTFADYRPAGGILVPYVAHTETSDGNREDVAVTRATVDAPGGATALRQPPSNVHDFSIANGATTTTVPFELVDNHVYLSVMLDGKGPYRFLFDTGGANVVDPAVIREIGAVSAGTVQGSGVGSGTDAFSFAKVATLGVGDARLENQLFAVAPVRFGFGISGGRPADGLIGFEVLSRFVTTFDYGSNRVVLALPGSPAPSATNGDVIPFVLDGRQPQFPCRIDDVASACTVDTGSRDAISLFSPFLAAHPAVVPHAIAASGVTGFGVGGPAFGRLGRLASLGIGRFALPQTIADFTSQTQGAFAAPFVGGNIGGDILKRFTLSLDYTTHRMTVVPNALFAVRDTSEHAGLFLLNQGGKKIVFDVRPGTPAAAAGLVKGDAIATIDGRDATALSLQDVRAVFMGDPGTILHLGIVSKDATAKTVTLTLREYV